MENAGSMGNIGSSLPRIGSVRRRAIGSDQGSLVSESIMFKDQGLPIVIEAATEGVNLLDWAKSHKEELDEKLLKSGAILFRGFSQLSLEAFRDFTSIVSTGELLQYQDASSPRSKVEGNIYTSTDYPASERIFPHSELSYADTYPVKIFFFCVQPSETGGETPIGDTRALYKKIDPAARAKFEDKGVLYVRNLGGGLGLDWRTVFNTQDKSEVEAFCARSGIELQWKEGDRLMTRQWRPAVVKHPRSGETMWFNHATFFHVTSLDPSLRDTLMAEVAEEDLPSNTYYGDGSPIEPDVLDALRALYWENNVKFLWQKGDLLMLDNLMCTHARESFTGKRKIVVGMTEPVSRGMRIQHA